MKLDGRDHSLGNITGSYGSFIPMMTGFTHTFVCLKHSLQKYWTLWRNASRRRQPAGENQSVLLNDWLYVWESADWLEVYFIARYFEKNRSGSYFEWYRDISLYRSALSVNRPGVINESDFCYCAIYSYRRQVEIGLKWKRPTSHTEKISPASQNIYHTWVKCLC